MLFWEISMRVFLSWSGERSRRVAEALRDWLPNVHQQVEIFFSPNDIEKGAKWANEIEVQLRDTQYCLVCLTAEALQSSWINFEAGAISKGIGQNRITPILFEIAKSQVSGPLSLFQLADFEKNEMLQVLKSINASFDGRLAEDILNKAFERWWPDLERDVASILKDSPSEKPPQKTQRELSDEILLNTREIMKQVGRIPSRTSRAIGLMPYVNREIVLLHKISTDQGNTAMARRIRAVGKKIADLNFAVGKTGGPSLKTLKEWLQHSAVSDEQEDVDEPLFSDSNKSTENTDVTK
jgi:TIR domain